MAARRRWIFLAAAGTGRTPGYLSRGVIGYGAWLAAETVAIKRSEQWGSALSRLAAILRRIRDGRVTRLLRRMQGALEYPQVYGTYPWGSGSALAFLAVQPGKSNDRAE